MKGEGCPLEAYNKVSGRADTMEDLRKHTQLHRAYMDWCESMVCEWKERVTLMGYGWPCWCIGTVGSTQTYHEWLKERVGL